MFEKQVSAFLMTSGIALRLAMLIVAACLLFASLATHAIAGDPAVLAESYESLDNGIAVRQAYMSWLAARQEAGMAATIRYIDSIEGPVERLECLSQEFHRTAAGITFRDSEEELTATLHELRNITRQFREETRWMMGASGGNNEDLNAMVYEAIETDSRTRISEDEYWMARMVAEPASFDRYIRESQATLTTLQEYGYDISAAQEQLDQISVLREEFIGAIRLRNYGAAEITREGIHAASASFEMTVKRISNPRETPVVHFPVIPSGNRQGTESRI